MKLKSPIVRKATRPSSLVNRTDTRSAVPPEERERRTQAAIDRYAFQVRWLWRRDRDSMGGRVRLYGGRVVVMILCEAKGWRWYRAGTGRGYGRRVATRRWFGSRAAAIKDAARQCRGDVGRMGQ